MLERKKHRAEYILTIIAGILLIVNGITFIAGLFVQLPEDEALNRMRADLGEEQFRLFQIRVIVASIISGIMLIILAIAMEKNPKELVHYGILTILVSIISILGIGLIYPVSVISIGVGVAGGIIAVMRGRRGVVVIEHKYKESYQDTEYICTICNLRFDSDDRLREHMLRHIREKS